MRCDLEACKVNDIAPSANGPERDATSDEEKPGASRPLGRYFLDELFARASSEAAPATLECF
jgi:hypothetical protein